MEKHPPDQYNTMNPKPDYLVYLLRLQLDSAGSDSSVHTGSITLGRSLFVIKDRQIRLRGAVGNTVVLVDSS